MGPVTLNFCGILVSTALRKNYPVGKMNNTNGLAAFFKHYRLIQSDTESASLNSGHVEPKIQMVA